MLARARFVNSEAWSYVDQARQFINASKLPDAKAEQEALAHVGMVIELLERRRADSDPREITPNMLSAVATSANNLANFIDSANSGGYEWAQVAIQADAVLDSLAAWPPLKIAHYLSGLNSATEAFEGKVAEAMEGVRKRGETVAQGLDEVHDRQSQLQEQVSTERQRISEAVATFTNDSTEAVAAVRKSQDERLADLISEWEERDAAAARRSAASLDRLDTLEREAQNVVHATTSHIVATDYGRYARNKTVAAWTCDIAAALVGAAGLAVVIYHLLSIDPSADANLGLSFTRFAVSLGTLGLAGLLGRRGQQHHLEARAAKRTDLSLRQVLPFTANLAPEDRQEIVREFTERVFIRGDIDSAQALVGRRKRAEKEEASGGDSAAAATAG